MHSETIDRILQGLLYVVAGTWACIIKWGCVLEWKDLGAPLACLVLILFPYWMMCSQTCRFKVGRCSLLLFGIPGLAISLLTVAAAVTNGPAEMMAFTPLVTVLLIACLILALSAEREETNKPMVEPA